MNREAQILQALQENISSEAKRALVAELNTIRAQASRRVATAREVELGKEAAAAHLTPAPTYVRHTTDTDWLGRVATVRESASEIHQQAKAEASSWMRQVSAFARADHEELRIQAVGYAQVWGSQFGELATVARDSFLQTASHLAGVKLAAETQYEDDDDAEEAYDDSDDGKEPPFGEDGEMEDDDDYDGPRKESRRVTARALSEIAREIENDWVNVNFGARPYLDAMFELNSINDAYYQDSAKSIVAYFLSNASSWRGETAKRVKDELKAMMSGKSAAAKVGYTNSYGLSDEGPNGLRRGMRVWIEGDVPGTVLFTGFDDITNNLAINPEELGYRMYQDSYPVAVATEGGTRIVQFDALAPARTASVRMAKDDQSWYEDGLTNSNNSGNGWTDDDPEGKNIPQSSKDAWGKGVEDRERLKAGEGSRRTAGNPHPVGTPAWFDWEADPDAEGKGPHSSGAPGGGIPLHGPLSAEQEAWMNKGRKKSASLDDVQRWCDRNGCVMKDFPDELIEAVAESGDLEQLGAYLDDMEAAEVGQWEASLHTAEADGIDSPSQDSQNGYGESTLSNVETSTAPENTNMGWISEGDPNADNDDNGSDQAITASIGVYVAAFMRQGADECGKRNPNGEKWQDPVCHRENGHSGSCVGIDASGTRSGFSNRNAPSDAYDPKPRQAKVAGSPAPAGEYERVKAFVNERWSGLYTCNYARDTPNGRIWESTLHGPGGPLVFTLVHPDGSMMDMTRGGENDDGQGGLRSASRAKTASFDGVPDSTKSMYADKETFPCGLCGKPATHYAYQEGSRASGTFACDGCIQYFAPGRIVVDASRKSAGLYPDENAAGVTTWADGYGTWHATADSAEEARAAIERELVARGEIDPQNYEVFVTLVDGRHYVESSPERPEVVSSRKHAEADGIDSPSPESQNGYAESTLPNVEVATAPEDTNLGWIADGDPNAEPEGSFDTPDNPIANEASRHTAANDNWSVEVTRSMTGNLVFTVFNDPTDPDHFAYGVHEPVASFSSFAAANAYIVRRGGTPVLERATQANEASLNARFARLVEAGENDRPAGAAPMVDQVTDDAEDDTDMFGGEWVHEGQRRQAVHPDDDPSQGPGYANDAPNMLGDPPGMDPEDYDMFAPELPKQARKITSAVKTEVVDGLPYPESGGKFKTPCVVVGHKGRIQLIASPSYVEDLPVSTLDEAIGHVLRRVQENAEMLGTTEYTLYVYRDSRTASLKTAMPAPADLGVKVGDIFYSSWGYDQTNVSFYEVVGLTPASVKVREVAKNYVEQNGPYGNKVTPQPGNYIGGEMTKRLQNSGYAGAAITINSSETAWLWDGKPQYETDSLYGH